MCGFSNTTTDSHHPKYEFMNHDIQHKLTIMTQAIVHL